MKRNTILGISMIILGGLLGLYVGVWMMFIGGIVGLVDVIVGMIHGSGVDGLAIGINIIKIMFAGLAGYLSALVLIIPGLKRL